MKKNILIISVLSALFLIVGCTQEEEFTGTGVVLKNELSSGKMQPLGSVLLRTSINNFFDNELQGVQARLTTSFGDLTVNPPGDFSVNDILANPNATARAQWTLTIGASAPNGYTYTSRVRVCFHYNQTAWHELALVNSFDVEPIINLGQENGPLNVIFSGLDMAYIQNKDVKSTIPISISIKNTYSGYIGKIDTPKDQVPNITYVELRIYDNAGGCMNLAENGSNTDCLDTPHLTGTLEDGSFAFAKPTANFEIMPGVINPSCLAGQDRGCLICNNALWKHDLGYFQCFADDLSVFGDETFLGVRLNVTSLDSEELIEKVEVMVSYDYCIESEPFVLTVFTPGGK